MILNPNGVVSPVLPHQRKRFNPIRVDEISGRLPGVAPESVGGYAGLNDFYPDGIDGMGDLIYE
jgi:hypothetical protein